MKKMTHLSIYEWISWMMNNIIGKTTLGIILKFFFVLEISWNFVQFPGFE